MTARSPRIDDETQVARSEATSVVDGTEYIYVDAPEPDDSGVWLASEAREHFSADVLTAAEVAECVADVDAHLGHYSPAYWLRAVAPLLDGRRREVKAIGTRCVRHVREDARLVARLYLTDNPRPPKWWQPELDGQLEDHLGEWLHGAADEVESLLGDLGYVTQWCDSGVSTWRVLGPVASTGGTGERGGHDG